MARPTIPKDLRRTKYFMVRLTEEEQREFRAAALMLGKGMSPYVHDHILDLIARAKTEDAAKFKRILAELREMEPEEEAAPRRRRRSARG